MSIFVRMWEISVATRPVCAWFVINVSDKDLANRFVVKKSFPFIFWLDEKFATASD